MQLPVAAVRLPGPVFTAAVPALGAAELQGGAWYFGQAPGQKQS